MNTHKLTLTVLPETFAVCRFDKHEAIPNWVTQQSFVSITRTEDELSIVCPQTEVPPDVPEMREDTNKTRPVVEKNWRCFKVAGPLDFALTGIMASLVGPLAHAGITVFAISTYETDYLMVRATSLDHAIRVLKLAEHDIVSTP